MRKNKQIFIAKVEDTNEIMKFINDEWKKNHILSVNKKFFLYEYGNKDLLNFVIFKNSFNKINGILGFLKSSSDQNATVWTTMWKVSKSNGSPMLGIELLNFLREQGYKSIMSSGINENTVEIYKYLKFKVGSLSQYFLLNEELSKYKIAIVPKDYPKKKFKIENNKEFFFKKLNLNDLKTKFDFNKYYYRKPFKDFNYFKKRFFEHPIYAYDIYGVFNNTSLLSILVTRINEYKKTSCIRIIDFYGEETVLSTFIYNLKKIMYSEDHEYIDFFSNGLDEKIIFNSGFLKLDSSNRDVVIPNYFEPFVRNNINIKYFSDTKDLKNLRIFKGDGDQDRPSVN
jgi:hypothetical protein